MPRRHQPSVAATTRPETSRLAKAVPVASANPERVSWGGGQTRSHKAGRDLSGGAWSGGAATRPAEETLQYVRLPCSWVTPTLGTGRLELAHSVSILSSPCITFSPFSNGKCNSRPWALPPSHTEFLSQVLAELPRPPALNFSSSFSASRVARMAGLHCRANNFNNCIYSLSFGSSDWSGHTATRDRTLR